MSLRTRCALPAYLLPCPKGIDINLTSFSALEAWQIHNERYSYGGSSGAWRIPTPGLFWKYEKMNRQLFKLSFPERAMDSVSLPRIHELLEAIETFIRLCFDLDDIKTGAMPERVLEGLYKYMRVNNIRLSDFGLEDAKTAYAFKGYHYGVRGFDSLQGKFKVVRRMYKEFNGDLEKLKDAWLLCMDDFALYLEANPNFDSHEAFHQTWGYDFTDIRDSLVEKFGTGGTIAEFQKFAAANPTMIGDQGNIKSSSSKGRLTQTTLGTKISSYLVFRSVRALSNAIMPNGGITQNWITENDTLILEDELNEMSCLDFTIEEALKEYARELNKIGKISIEGVDLKQYSIGADGKKGEIVFPAKPGSEFFMNSSGWWLNGAHKVIAVSGTIIIERKKSLIEIKSADIEMEWIDVIDANPSYNEDNLIKATLEYAFKAMDAIIKARYPIKIKWRYKK